MTQRHRTLLDQLVAADERSQVEIVVAWNALARHMKEKTSLSQRQFDRWLGGEVESSPRPGACRVSHRFWGRPMDELLGPPTTAVTREHHPEPVDPAPDLRTLVMATASESGDHAASVARYVDPSSIDELRDRVFTAARSYATTSPLNAFAGLLRTRNLAYNLLDRTGQPSQQKDIYLLASQACSLLAGATLDLGHPHEASQHARAAYTYARLIDHTTAQGFALAIQCTLTLWTGQPTRGLDFAEEGLRLRSTGTLAVRLHSVAARCWGLKGDHEKAREYLAAAEGARGGPVDDICDEIGGEFGFSPARSAFSAGATHLALEEGSDAVRQATLALDLYRDAAPEDRWYGGEYGARADLVAAHVIDNDLEQAEEELGPLMELQPDHRTERIVLRIRRLQQELSRRRYGRDPHAMRLASALEGFVTDSTRPALPGPS